MRSFLALLFTALLMATCLGFNSVSMGRTVGSNKRGGVCASHMIPSSKTRCSPRTVLFSSTESEKEPPTESSQTTTSPEAAATPTYSEPVPVQLDEESGVPLDLPSPLLLASSIILAIVSTGSLFDLIGGSPTFGFLPTAGAALVGLPLCFFLFYAAIVKGQAETEEDDKKFTSGGF